MASFLGGLGLAAFSLRLIRRESMLVGLERCSAILSKTVWRWGCLIDCQHAVDSMSVNVQRVWRHDGDADWSKCPYHRLIVRELCQLLRGSRLGRY